MHSACRGTAASRLTKLGIDTPPMATIAQVGVDPLIMAITAIKKAVSVFYALSVCKVHLLHLCTLYAPLLQ